jgi:hypothetical protein
LDHIPWGETGLAGRRIGLDGRDHGLAIKQPEVYAGASLGKHEGFIKRKGSTRQKVGV